MARYITLSEFQEAYLEALRTMYPHGFADVDETVLGDKNHVVNLYAYRKATEKYMEQQYETPNTLQRRRHNRAR